MTDNDHEFSVIIVTHNNESDILPCIKSIKKYDIYNDIEIIIVDNKSTDKTLENIKLSDLLNIKIIKMPENKGFSVASNQGAYVCTGINLLFLNPDTIILNNIFKIAREKLKQNNIGCIGVKVINDKGYEMPFALRFPSKKKSILNALYRNFLNISFTKELKIDSTDDIIECDWVLGACFFIRRDLFFKIGGFDESFFLYFEDIDFCKRIKAAEYRIIADSRCHICHKKYGSRKNISKWKIMKIKILSEKIYYTKHIS
jgi:hypothetical protein